MQVDQFDAVHLFLAVQLGNQRVNAAQGDHGDPAQGARMHVADGPVGVMGQGVDGLDGHHRSFEGGHAVEGQGDDQEFQDRIRAQLMPGTGEGHDAVDHAAPGGGQQDEGEQHP